MGKKLHYTKNDTLLRGRANLVQSYFRCSGSQPLHNLSPASFRTLIHETGGWHCWLPYSVIMQHECDTYEDDAVGSVSEFVDDTDTADGTDYEVTHLGGKLRLVPASREAEIEGDFERLVQTGVDVSSAAKTRMLCFEMLYAKRLRERRGNQAYVDGDVADDIRGSNPPMMTMRPKGVTPGGQELPKRYSIFYLLHARDHKDLVTRLCLGVSSLGRAMQRQSDNRNHLIAQGMTFLSQYQTIRRQDREHVFPEIQFNFGRAFQQLGRFGVDVTRALPAPPLIR
ncbi:hypothetical protein BU15DRAFT_60913 [Melanogaster broomeanus]|nr:hypothetical protein BU15DRAFT_60913 [Melanogaster broomeanus]